MLLIGIFVITIYTKYIRLFLWKFCFAFLMYARRRSSKSNNAFSPKFLKSNSYFWKHRKSLQIWDKRLTMFKLRIDFNGYRLWLPITVHLQNLLITFSWLFPISTFMLSDNTICPRNTMYFAPMFMFSLSQLLQNFENTFIKLSLCYEKVVPYAIISSWKIALSGTSEIMEVISSWKIDLLNKFRGDIVYSNNVVSGYQILGNVSISHLLLFANIPKKHRQFVKKLRIDWECSHFITLFKDPRKYVPPRWAFLQSQDRLPS